MTVVKRTNRCATVAFGCDRSSARDERTNERDAREDESGLERFSTCARALGKTWDDDEKSARAVKMKD